MKKNILSFVLLSVLIFSACAQQKKTTNNASVKSASGKKSTNNIEQIAMERTPCFGTCQAYRLEVNKNGHVKFISRHFTKYEGTYEKDFPVDKVNNLFNSFAAHKVDTCQEEYTSMIQDVPGVMFYITRKNGEQTIKNAHFGPAFLKTLALEVDSFYTVDETWKKTADAEKD